MKKNNINIFKTKFISKTKLPRITEENFLGLMIHKPREICLEIGVFNDYAAKNFLGFGDVFPFQASDIVRVINNDDSVELSFVVIFSYKGDYVFRIIHKF